jgi:hypothetical protein
MTTNINLTRSTLDAALDAAVAAYWGKRNATVNYYYTSKDGSQ